MKTEYIQCKRCVMDNTSKHFTIHANGYCNFCNDFNKLAERTIFTNRDARYASALADIEEIKSRGKNKKYDCIIGVSGGVDSSYIALLAMDYGLRPLLVHFDNGWNDELAVKNIDNLVKYTSYDLYTYVIDWDGFRDMQRAYFEARVIDLEVPTDMFITGALYDVATKYGIKSILSGNNIWTEAILPYDWRYRRKLDYKNMSSIYEKFGTGKLKKIPHVGIDRRSLLEMRGYKWITLFDRLDFNDKKVKERMVKEFGYRIYPCKHFESVFTRFYQGYYLRKKFNIDKRKAHLSNLIMTDQITRESAVKELLEEPYEIERQLEDKKYIEKKWELNSEEFDRIMNQPAVEHSFYGEENERPSWYIYMFRYLKLVYLYKFAYPLKIKARPTAQ